MGCVWRATSFHGRATIVIAWRVLMEFASAEVGALPALLIVQVAISEVAAGTFSGVLGVGPWTETVEAYTVGATRA